MTNYRHIDVEQRGAVRWLWLNRPEVRNAFNDALIADIAAAFADVEAHAATRVVVIAARGQAFCAGADLNWMRAMAGFSHARQSRGRAQGGAHVQCRACLLEAGDRASAGRRVWRRRRPRGRLRYRRRGRCRELRALRGQARHRRGHDFAAPGARHGRRGTRRATCSPPRNSARRARARLGPRA